MKPLLAILLCLLLTTPIHALILTVKGNAPVEDRGWPAGSVDLANLKTRAGYWEGPPFGGGRYVFEYQGDTAALQQAVDLLAKVKSPNLRIIIHEDKNVGFFCKAEKDKTTPGMDWSFTVWIPENFKRLYGGGNFEIISAKDPSGNLGKAIEPPTIDVYLGAGHIDWKQIKVPASIKVIDERASAAGYAPADGSVCRGQVFEMAGNKPLSGATVSLGDSSTRADADGKFELKNVSPGNHPIVFHAPGYASRVIGYAAFGKDTLKEYTGQLAAASSVSGIVKDQDGNPVPGATVRGDGIVAADGTGYMLNDRKEVTADAAGKFEMTGLPAGGTLHFYTYSKTHAPLDILSKFKIPADNLELRVTATGTIKGKVVDANGEPDSAASSIEIFPEGGPKAGKWSASGRLDANASFSFDGVPPGRYVVTPFPGRQYDHKPDPSAKTVEIKAGQTTEVEVSRQTTPAAAPAKQPAQREDAKDKKAAADLAPLLEKIYKPYGGYERLSQLTSFAEIQSSASHYIELPDKYRVEYLKPNSKEGLICIFDGKGFRRWQRDATGKTTEVHLLGLELPPEHWLEIIKYYGPRELLRLKDPDNQLSQLADTQINGHAAVALQINDKNSHTRTFYFDKETNLLVKENNTLYQNYKTFDGLPIATKRISLDAQGKPSETIDVTDFKVVDKFPPEFFKQP